MEEKDKIFSMRDSRSKEILKILCKDFNSKDKNMVEIGSYTGESTEIFAQCFRKVFAIDPWEIGMNITAGADERYSKPAFMNVKVEKIFDERMLPYNNVVKIKDFDYNVVNVFHDKSLDFVYIDSIHTKSEVIRTIKSWMPKLKPTGLIGGHDYTEAFPEVIEAIHETIGFPDKIYLDIGNSWTKYIYINW